MTFRTLRNSPGYVTITSRGKAYSFEERARQAALVRWGAAKGTDVDNRRFDDLAKTVAGASRRSLLKVALGGVLGGSLSAIGLRETDAAVLRKIGQVCRKDGDCTTGLCSPLDSRGRGRCICDSAADCPTPKNKCQQATCSPAGTCGVAAKNCDDNNACTIDTCNPQIGCVHTPINCNDGNACTTDTCDVETGLCVHQPVNCDDGNACTIDSCNPQSGCVHTQIICDDSNACTRDTCDPQLGCVFTPIQCDDGNACTTDSCNPQVGCVFVPITCPAKCDPGVGCVECLVASDCADFGKQCKTATCDNGVCTTVLTAEDTVCSVSGNGGACDAFGTCCMTSRIEGVCRCPEGDAMDNFGSCCAPQVIHQGTCS